MYEPQLIGMLCLVATRCLEGFVNQIVDVILVVSWRLITDLSDGENTIHSNDNINFVLLNSKLDSQIVPMTPGVWPVANKERVPRIILFNKIQTQRLQTNLVSAESSIIVIYQNQTKNSQI